MLKNEETLAPSLLSDEQILEEVAKRLQKQYQQEHGNEFLYGSFRFIFHDGRFQGVEDWPRNKRYVSPKRFNENR
ncbi:MAG: hypothetical protein K2X47_16580 [Bdellovibrionales bacterium]|nr:hypothetical protein [Bdellovibrionales bacterium]